MSVRYLSARLAQQIDEELMSSAGAFSLDQLMELAGLACAQTLAKVYSKDKYPRVLVCCGPGNQGGDGLVAARHLGQFGYKPTIYMPKPGSKDIYKRLQRQCDNMQITTLEPSTDPVDSLKSALGSSDVILDAIFGFSFKPPIRAPFDSALKLISESGLPIVSVDIPSGWDVEQGNEKGLGLNPDILLSLTAPKEGVKSFTGRHFLGGRFVPKSLEEKHQLNLPEYPGYDQIVELQDASHKLDVIDDVINTQEVVVTAGRPLAVELFIRVDQAYVPILSIPRDVCYRFAFEPLRWLRFLGYVIYGNEGDISTTADGLPVNYHSALEDTQYYYVSPVQPRLLDVHSFNDRVSNASTTSSRMGFRDAMKERDKRCIFTDSDAEVCEAAHIFPHSTGSEYMRRVIAYRGGEGLGIDEINHIRNGIFIVDTLHKLHTKGRVAFLKTPNFALGNEDIPPSPGPTIASRGRFILQHISDSMDTVRYFSRNFPHNLDARLPEDMETFPHSIITDMAYGSAALNTWGVRGAHDTIVEVLGSTHYNDVEPDDSDPLDQEEDEDDFMKENCSPTPRPESPSTSKRLRSSTRRERKLAERSGMDRAMECISIMWLLSSPKPQEQPSLSEEREVRKERLNEWLKVL